MTLADHADKIAFSTLFLPDKVFLDKYTGSFTVAASSSPGSGRVTNTVLTNPHGENVFAVMLYTIDGNNWYDGGQSIQTGLGVTLGATAYTTPTGIRILANNFTGSSYTLTYKIALISND